MPCACPKTVIKQTACDSCCVVSNFTENWQNLTDSIVDKPCKVANDTFATQPSYRELKEECRCEVSFEGKMG